MSGFRLAHRKFCMLIENQKTTREMFKTIRISDPIQRPALPRDLTQYSNLNGLSTTGKQIFDDWRFIGALLNFSTMIFLIFSFFDQLLQTYG